MKPKVSTFLYCNGFNLVQAPGGAIPEPSGLMQIITPPLVPSSYSFGVMFGLLGIKTECADNKFTYKFIGPDKNVVFEINNTKLPPIQTNQNLDDDMQGFFANFDIRNVFLRLEGEYISQIFLNNELLGEYPIKVKAVGGNDSQ